ncbi:uncharacterized protein LOC128999392 [Macrosteles quadrilineatus]|uniref:uncharacterized protein LOC128999392 n=1 Tax=Macrosteles quadrilineatus TaxID=74068 RepID=UPI0023E2296F|nr:uncharacterized protein LOC128999392 [Macrosteles quadrilineatus]
MDLIYMTDVMAYQSIRGPVYNNYDIQINNDQTKNQKVHQKNKEKEPCKICQERKRRSLMKYIRSKSHDHSDNDIKEEEDEEEPQEKQMQDKQEAKKR